MSAQEAARRLTADGPNALGDGKGTTSLAILLGQFKSLIIWILIAAGILSGVLGDAVDAIAILPALCLATDPIDPDVMRRHAAQHKVNGPGDCVRADRIVSWHGQGFRIHHVR